MKVGPIVSFNLGTKKNVKGEVVKVNEYTVIVKINDKHIKRHKEKHNVEEA